MVGWPVLLVSDQPHDVRAVGWTAEHRTGVRRWLAARRVPIEHPSNSEDVILSQVGYELYEKFFKQYTLKQWGRHPRELDASVCGRIPVRVTRDDRYLSDRFQALPSAGYTAMFERLLAANRRIRVLLRTDFRQVLGSLRFRHLVYTGAIDEYYNFSEGALGYRSLRFEHEPIDREYFQPGMQVNYPNDHAFTRIVEIKHATGQRCPTTTITREYPESYAPGRERCYPIPTPDNQAVYAHYAERAARDTGVTFVGRLGRYVYCNMDQAVTMALEAFAGLAARHQDLSVPLRRTA